MPADRVEDSYAIYLLFIFGDRLTGVSQKPPVESVTKETQPTMASDKPCSLARGVEAEYGPRGITVPPDRRRDFARVLVDFDRHCHESVLLTPDGFGVAAPVVLNFNGTYSFSEVYFDPSHTLAIVWSQVTSFGSGRFGGSAHQRWNVAEKKNGYWHFLDWQTPVSGWVS
jgi:hypothetical protein